MRLLLLSLLLTAVTGFCPVLNNPIGTVPRTLSMSNQADNERTQRTPLIQQEVSRRVALVMAAAAAATGNIPAAHAVALSTKVETIEYENIKSVNSDGAPEKHLPLVEVADGLMTVVVPHVMDPVKPHFIEYVWLRDEVTNKIVAVKKFDATDASPPTLKATVQEGSKVRALLYCNLHGLWQGEVIIV